MSAPGNTDGIRFSPEDIAHALGNPAPTEEQSRIISADLSPRLVVAGAGSGKTATMVDRVVWLVVNGLVRPDEVLGVTFTKKAAGELRHRMTQRLAALREEGLYEPDAGADEPVLDPTVSTYHSFAKSLVSEYGLRIGIEKDATQLGQAQCFQLVAQIVENWDGEMPGKVPASATLVTNVLQMSGECSEHLRTPAEVEDFCRRSLSTLRNLPNNHPKKLKKEERLRATLVEKLEQKLLVAQLTERYRRVKQAMQVMDFGDLLAYAATMARGIDSMAEEQRQLYRVVLLDEFQDTSHAQMVLFSSLFGNGHSVMAVGDPKQSIYGFRGASEGQLFDFYRYFPSSHQDADYLTVAWRNGTRILDAANQVAHPLATPGAWVRAASPVHVPDLVPRPEAPEGNLLAGVWETDQEEASGIVSTIASHRHQAELAGRPTPTAAVLCRARRHMETVRAECERQSVPYQVVGLGGLVNTPEVMDVVAVLRVLSDPSRSDSLMRLMAGARWRIGPRDLMALNDWARFLARRRRRSILTGLAEDLATPEGQAPGEEALRTADNAEHLAEASQHLDELMRSGGDQSESASLIEAIETLPDPGWTSAAGRSVTPEARERLARLRDDLEELRGYLGEDLTSLLYHIERVTLLDLELASRPGRDVHEARANLDAFYQAAADYCANAPRLAASLDAGARMTAESMQDEDLNAPEMMEHRYTVTSSASGVTAFLAWLEATVAEESGLALPVGASDSSAVQILTVHAAKGLEWDEVYVQGLVDGGFPSDKADTWYSDAGALPWSLRGDSDYLPALDLAVGSTQELEESGVEFQEHNRARTTSEERRLAYVATTRARSVLMLTSSRWSGTKSKPNTMSRFVEEITVETAPVSSEVEWLHEAPVPEEGSENPQGQRIHAALWPFDPLTRPFVSEWDGVEALDDLTDAPDRGKAALDPGPVASRRADVERAASLVLARLNGSAGGASSVPDSAPVESSTASDLPDPQDWDEETGLLLALHRARGEGPSVSPAPTHVSASLLVGLAQDPDRIRRQMRRPMPRRPEASARAGTRFHAWVEEHYGTPGMLDLGEDVADPEEGDADFTRLQEAFRASPWFDRQPWAIEYPLETPLAGFTVRGRVDAVFRDEDAEGNVRYELVDWKTGRVPHGDDLAHKAVQLAVYRLGFARLHGIDPENISAAFYYVAHDRTIRPRDVADEAQLARLLSLLQEGNS